MNVELGRMHDPMPHAEKEADGSAPELRSHHVEAILAQQPSAEAQLQSVLQLKVMKDAVARVMEKTDAQIAEDLAAGLRDAWENLGTAAPQSVADLDAHEALPEVGTRPRSVEEIHAENLPTSTGSARDYFMQRLTGVHSIAQLIESGMTLPPALEESLQREADRLATLLVSFVHAERPEDSVETALAA